jgi:hypothetical protein
MAEDIAARLEQIRARHQCIPRHTQTIQCFFTGERTPWPPEDACGRCEQPWPCDAGVLLARVAQQQGELAALREVVAAAIRWRDARVADVTYRSQRVHALDSAEAYSERERLRAQRDAAHDAFWRLVAALEVPDA